MVGAAAARSSRTARGSVAVRRCIDVWKGIRLSLSRALALGTPAETRAP
jgi:hypothetical protein